MKNGLYKLYYNNGQLFREQNYINNVLNGIYKAYYKTGELDIKCYYKDNKLNGLYKSYNKSNGELNYISYDINDLEYYLEFNINEFIINI